MKTAVQTLIVLALVFASFVAIFALQNAQTVPIRIFAWERETSVAVIVLVTAAVGALTAVLAGLVRQVKAGIRVRQLRSELAKVNKLLSEERERASDLESRLSALAGGQDRESDSAQHFGGTASSASPASPLPGSGSDAGAAGDRAEGGSGLPGSGRNAE